MTADIASEHFATGAYTVSDLRDRLSTAEAFQRICTDLDRCEHGRHEGDVCSGCGGASHGNPRVLLAGGIGRILGYTIDGAEIIIPSRNEKYDPAKWFRR